MHDYEATELKTLHTMEWKLQLLSAKTRTVQNLWYSQAFSSELHSVRILNKLYCELQMLDQLILCPCF